MQRPAVLAAFQFLGKRLRLLTGLVAGHEYPGPDLAFQLIDAGQTLVQQVNGREFSGADLFGGLVNGPHAEISEGWRLIIVVADIVANFPLVPMLAIKRDGGRTGG